MPSGGAAVDGVIQDLAHVFRGDAREAAHESRNGRTGRGILEYGLDRHPRAARSHALGVAPHGGT